MKKIAMYVFVCVTVVSGLYVCASTAHAQTPVFTRTLYIGSQGADVTALQKFLNVPATGYFGTQTAAAVREFQLKNAATILHPYGFTRPTGIVSSATITVLNSYINPIATSTNILSTTAPGALNQATNPNLRNIDKVMASLDRVMTRKNVPPAQMAETKRLILESMATTTDLNKQFLEITRPYTISVETKKAGFRGLFAKVGKAFASLLPQSAQAVVTGLPFGGYQLAAYPCTCTYGLVWGVVVEPLPPTYAVSLGYTLGTQIYSYYSLPFSPAVLGHYAPVVNKCLMGVTPYCTLNMAIEGSITPVTGSAI